jgi:hypothetical protein
LAGDFYDVIFDVVILMMQKRIGFVLMFIYSVFAFQFNRNGKADWVTQHTSEKKPLIVWTSTLKRTVETAQV